MLFVAGGALYEHWTDIRPQFRWARVVLPAFVLVGGLNSAPIVLPILPVDRIQPYMQALGMGISRTQNDVNSTTPQHCADEVGWEEMVATVAEVYHSLPPERRAETAIFSGDYGEAGAIDFFGARYGLPKAIRAHQNYYYWGPRDYTGESIILLQWTPENAQKLCSTVTIGPRIEFPYTMGWEHHQILICQNTKRPLQQVWARLKVWN